MLQIKQTSQFKKDLKAAIKQGCDLDLLTHVIDTLAQRKPLAPHHRDHALSGMQNYFVSDDPHCGLFFCACSNPLSMDTLPFQW